MVGAGRLELPISCSQSRRASHYATPRASRHILRASVSPRMSGLLAKMGKPPAHRADTPCMNWTSGARDENDSSLLVLAAAVLAALVLAAIPVLETRGNSAIQAPSGYLPDVSNVSVDLEVTVPPVGGGWNAGQIMLES